MEGKNRSHAECMLKHYAMTRDAKQIIVNEVDMDVGGKIAVAYK